MSSSDKQTQLLESILDKLEDNNLLLQTLASKTDIQGQRLTVVEKEIKEKVATVEQQASGGELISSEFVVKIF